MKHNNLKSNINRQVWNPARNTWVKVAANSANAKRPALRRNLLATAIVLAFAPLAQAAPIGGQVVSGAGSISQSGSTTNIQQTTQNLSLDWQSFNIAAQETVNFLQPSSSAIAVNRILDTNGTQILGNLNANGQVFLINPNGILFGQGAQVNVGGLVASTLDLNDASLNSGSISFSGDGIGSIDNQGTINAASGGYVALLGNTVSNQGTITAQLGSVALGAGSAATLTFNGNSLVHMQVDQSTLDNLAENKALIQADGGQVVMTAGAKDALLASVVNNAGVIEARTVQNNNGTITLLGGMAAGIVNVGGTLDASAPNGGDGGFIETSAAQVNVADGTQVTTAAANGLTGSWLIDPVNFTIGTDITGAALGLALGSGSVTISTLPTNVGSCTGIACTTPFPTSGLGDIIVNDTVSWSSGNTLTLTAEHDININNSITATNGGLTLSAANSISATAAVNVGTFTLSTGNWVQNTASLPTFSASDFRIAGGTFLRVLGGDGLSAATAYQLTDIYGVQGMSGFLTKNFVLNNDVNASGTSAWNTGAGFVPIGQAPFDTNPANTNTYQSVTDFTKSFQGTFDGKGHTISGLTINLPLSTDPWGVGLFGVTKSGSSITNVNMSNVNITGYYAVGGLVGANYGTVSSSHTTAGTITGYDSVGGLVGFNYGTVTGSYATANVDGIYGNMGGLVGFNYGNVSNSYATGTVSGIDITSGGGDKRIGGLVGANYLKFGGGAIISNSYATGTVIGGADSYDVGGLVGRNIRGTIQSSYATGAVSGAGFNSFPGGQGVGGLVGYSYGNGTAGLISNSYATGNVTGTTSSGNIGGLAGYNAATISNSYATGTVSGGANAGGLVGTNSSDVSTSTYYGTINNSYAAGAVSGGTNAGGLVGLNDSGNAISNSYATGTVSGGTNAGGLLGLNNGTITDSHWNSAVISTGIATNNNSVATTGTTGLDTAGMKLQSNFSTWDLASTWIIYDTFTNPLLRSFMTPLTVTASNLPKTYDGLAVTATGVTCSLGLCSSLTNLLGTFNWGGATNAGTYLPSVKSGLYSNQQGYIISYVNGTLTVNPANLTLSGTRVYDGTSSVAGSVLTATGVNGEIFTVTGAGDVSNLLSKNVQTSSTLASLTGLTLGTSANGGLSTNYNVLSTSGSSVSITPATLALSGTRVYDGTSSVAGSVLTATGVNGEIFTVTGAGDVSNLLSKNVQTSSTLASLTGLTLGTSANGGLSTNYNVLSTSGSSVSITPATLALSGTRVYDGTSSVAGSVLTATGVNGEIFTVTGAGDVSNLLSKNVQTSSTLASLTGLTLGTSANGGLSTNYNVLSTSGSSVSITPATLALSGTRVYDGTSSVAGSVLTATGVNGEIFTVTGAGDVSNLLSKNVQTSSTLASLTGLTLGTSANGGLSTNYNVLSTSGSSVSITPATLALSGTRVYDGTSSVAGSVLTATGVNGEIFTVTGAGDVSNLLSKNVQTSSTLASLTGLTLGTSANGGLSTNYNVLSTSGSSVSITPATLALSGTRVYDGTSSVAGSVLTATGVNGEIFTVTGAGDVSNLLSKNVQTSSTLASLTGLTLGTSANGGLSTNYNVLSTSGSSVSITPATLALSGTRVYDGTSSVAGSVLTATGVNGEIFTVTGAGDVSNLLSKNVQTSSTLASLTGLTLGTSANGGLSTNYNVLSTAGSTVDITAKPISVISGITVDPKVYDGNTNATPVVGTVVFGGNVSGDDVVITPGIITATFSDKNVGTNKPVDLAGVALSGADAGNYTVNGVSGVTGVITAAPLTATITAPDKVYDGTTTATPTFTITSGLIGTETVTASGTATFNSKDVLTANLVTADSNVLADGTNGGLASNYSLVTGQTVIAHITPTSLGVTADNLYKFFAAADPLLTYGNTGLVSGDNINSVLSGNLIRDTGENTGLYAINQGNLNSNGNYTLTFTPGVLRIVPFVEPAQPTTQVAQSGSTVPLSLPSLVAQIDRQQEPLVIYKSNDTTYLESTQQLGGNGPAVTILDGGVRMPEEREDRQ